MATFKSTGGVSRFQDQMIEGMVTRGYTRDFAERTFRQIEGFGSYGFPESHAASFAKIAYASSWMKCRHPDVFCAAILNAQPMGFYQPAQLVRDAQQHGVEVRPVCVNRSRWDTRMEEEEEPSSRRKPGPQAGKAPYPPRGPGFRRDDELLPLRLGLRMVRGLSNLHAARILAARADSPFASVEDVWRRTGIPVAALEKLADADAFAALGLDRRQALWRVRGLGEAPLPVFAAADALGEEPEVALTPLTGGREVVEDYRTVQLSLRAHPLAFLREALGPKVTTCAGLARLKDGSRVEVAGLVLIRQRPGKGNVTFITIEDETGIANVILWQRKFEAQRRVVMGAAMIAVKGVMQKEGEVIHVIADRLEDRTPLLHRVGAMDFPHLYAPADGGKGESLDPRGVIKVKSRDFH
jgi:error-prone DNA polymerase